MTGHGIETSLVAQMLKKLLAMQEILGSIPG